MYNSKLFNASALTVLPYYKNTRMFFIKTSGCFKQEHGDVLSKNIPMFCLFKSVTPPP